MNKFRELKADEIECYCTEDGRIFNVEKREMPLRNCNGYLSVTLKTKNGRKTCLVHRLIAMCFLDNPDNKPCVNHKDGNKRNNSVENLEWCTYSENELHSYRVLGKKVNMDALKRGWDTHARNSATSVMQIDDTGSVVAVYKSQAEAHNATGISQGNISECCKGRRLHAGGYAWAKVNNEC